MAALATAMSSHGGAPLLGTTLRYYEAIRDPLTRSEVGEIGMQEFAEARILRDGT